MKAIGKRRSRFVLLLALMMAFNPIFGVKAAQTDNPVFYESTTTETVTSGVLHEHMIRFTKQGWQNINVLRVDVTNPYIKLETLINHDALVIPKTTAAFVEEKGVVAAINASFFNTTHNPGETMSIGPVVESGKIKSASYGFNRDRNHMATFSVDVFDQALIEYWKTELSLVSQSGKSIPVGRYNMPYYGYNDLTVLDSSWGEFSPGSANSDFVEMVVENNRVVDIRNYKPAVRLPKNGFVVVTKKAGVHLLNSNFRIGETIRFEVKTNPDLKNIQTAVTGGGVLVNQGVIPSSFTHDVAGIHPRTAIGVTKDKKNVIMVTVDGRQQGKRGMTLLELASLMKELGAYNALNLDGGGSTVMMARKEGQTDVTMVNSPSDKTQRRIPTALGVTVHAPFAPMQNLYINTDDTNVFVNSGRALRVTATDQNHNSMNISNYNALWSVSGVEGTFKDNVFYPTTTGRGKITARLNNITAELDILVLDSPVKLIPPTAMYGVKGETMALPTIIGVDKNGLEAKISPKDIQWTVNRSIGTVEAGDLTPFNSGTEVVTVSFGQAKAYTPLRVASIRSYVLDDFESKDLYGNGTMQLSYGQKYSGISAGMMSYNYFNTDKMTATVTYKGAGLLIDKSASRLSLQVQLNQRNFNRISAQVTDANGGQHTVVLADSMDWTGWKRLDASIESIAKPARLTGISVTKTKEGLNAGFITIDELTLSEITYPKNAVSLPNVKEPGDPAYKPTASLRPKGNLHFTVMGQVQPKESVLMPRFDNISGAFNNLYDFVAFTGTGSMEEILSLYIPTITTKAGYSSSIYEDNLVIHLDTKNKSLTGSPEQWNWFLKQLDQSKANNVFIFMTDAPGAFTDQIEAALFSDSLGQQRKDKFSNVWVFSEGKTDSVHVKNGVRYIQSKRSSDDFQNVQYMLVTVDGTDVSYEYKQVNN